MSLDAEPLEEGIEETIGTAQQPFPDLLPRVFRKYAEITGRVAQRREALRQQKEAEWEAEAAAQAEIDEQERGKGETSTEFTTLLMEKLEEKTITKC